MREPYLEERHDELDERVGRFAAAHLTGTSGEEDPEAGTREVARRLGAEGLLAAAVPPPAGCMDLRSLCVVRERLAWHSGLADSAFAMQGLGSHALSAAGDEAQRGRWLPRVISGEVLCAFAVTEPEAGSDLHAVTARARRDGDGWRLEGVKTLISNGGIAGLYCVLARTSDAAGHRGLSMLLVEGAAPGLTARRLEPMAPHPLGELLFDSAPAELIGEEGRGLRIALGTLDTFRPSVGAAACGLAARALHEAIRHVKARKQFGAPLAEREGVRMALAEMQVELDAARLLVQRAAWARDCGAPRITREGACAKLYATEMAQRVVDRAVQLHGGIGVLRGTTVERLYREVRALRIYEGASEIQKLLIARTLLEGADGPEG